MKKIKAYKAFDKELKCRGFQFEIGKSYHEENVSICESGFHSCENPFDVLNYYDLTECRFAEVEAFGSSIEKHKDDSKIASSDITIVRELTLTEFISVVWDYVYNIKDGSASGDGSKLAASGDGSQLAASGNRSQLAASGYWSQLAASGYWSKLAASGDGSKLAASGDGSQLEITGQISVAANIGINGKIKASKGTWITLAEYDENNICVCVKSAKVDGELIKSDVWYMLKNGEFTEC